jgi:hypothetical protein
MSNGTMVGELRTLAACEQIDSDACQRLILAALADVIERQDKHTHDDRYARKAHNHPWHTITATVATIGTTVAVVWAALKP